MTKKKDNLFEIIKNLTPSEKRYFKLFVKNNNQQSDNKYIQLFDAINQQKEYEEAPLLKKFGYLKNRNGLAVVKNYLSQLILRSLRHYGSRTGLETEVIELIQDTHTLYIRRLFGAAQKQIEKARKMAEDGMRHDLLLAIGKWERRLVIQEVEVEAFAKSYEAIMEREKKATHDLLVHTTLFTQYKKLFFHNLREGFQKRESARDTFFTLLQHPLLDQNKQSLNPTARLYYYLCYYEFYHGMRDLVQRKTLAEKTIGLFEKHPFLIEFDTESYLTAQVNYLYTQMDAGNLEHFEKKIKELRDLDMPKDRQYLVRRKEIDYFHLMLHYCEIRGQYHQAVVELIPQINNFFSQNKHSLIDRDEFFLKITGAWINLVVGKIDEAAIWLSYLENEIDRNSFMDFFKVSRILQLAVHYTQKHFVLVESMAKSTLRFLNSKNKLTETDAFILKFFKKAGSIDDVPEKQNKLLRQLKEDLETMIEYIEFASPYRLENVVLWIESLLTKKTLLALLQQKHRWDLEQLLKEGESIHLIPEKIGFVLRRGN